MVQSVVHFRRMDRQDVAFNAVLTLLSRIVPFILALLIIPVTIRGMGVERFGILALVWALLAQLSFFDFGIGKACTVLVAEAVGRGEPRRVGSIVWTALQVQVGLGLLGAGAVFLAVPAIVDLLIVPAALAAETVTTFRIAAICLPFLIGGIALRGGLEGVQRFDVISGIEVLSKCGLLVVPAAGAVLEWRLATIALFLVGTQVLAFAAYVTAALMSLPDFGRGWPVSVAEVGSLIRFGKWIALSSIVGPMMIYLDRWVIGSALNLSAVAYYTTPFDMIFRVSVVSQSVIAALFPALTTLYALKRVESAEAAAGIAARFVLLTVGLIGAAVILLSRDLLTIWLGAEFARQSTTVLQILALGLVINSVARIPYASVQAVGRPDVTAKLHLAELPVYVALLAVGVQIWGIAGAAAAWTTRVALDGILLVIAQRKLSGRPAVPVRSSRLVQGAFVIAAAAGAAATAQVFMQTVGFRVAATAVLLVIGAAAGHRLVLDRADRQVLRDLFNRGMAAVAR